MDKSTLISGLPVYIQGVGKLYQPNMKKILEYGEDYYNALLYPFFLDMEELINDEVKKEYKPFDLFFIKKSENEFLLQQKNTREHGNVPSVKK
jgi:hypothetical protein